MTTSNKNGAHTQHSKVDGPSRRQAQRSELHSMTGATTQHVNVESKTLPVRDGINGLSYQRVDELRSTLKPQEDSVNPKKKLILNAFVEMCSGHQSPGLWR